MIKFVCKLCDGVFDNEEELYEHLRQYHKVAVMDRHMVRYELEEWVKKGLEKVLDADVRICSVYSNFIDLEVSVSASNVPFFWKKVVKVMSKLVELGWYPEYMDGSYDRYLMEWHAVVYISLDKIEKVIAGNLHQ